MKFIYRFRDWADYLFVHYTYRVFWSSVAVGVLLAVVVIMAIRQID